MSNDKTANVILSMVDAIAARVAVCVVEALQQAAQEEDAPKPRGESPAKIQNKEQDDWTPPAEDAPKRRGRKPKVETTAVSTSKTSTIEEDFFSTDEKEPEEKPAKQYTREETVARLQQFSQKYGFEHVKGIVIKAGAKAISELVRPEQFKQIMDGLDAKERELKAA